MSQSTRKDKQFNVLMSLSDFEMLEAIATSLRTSKGQVVRNLIYSAHTMMILDQPVCANGRQCIAPQLHPRATNPTQP